MSGIVVILTATDKIVGRHIVTSFFLSVGLILSLLMCDAPGWVIVCAGWFGFLSTLGLACLIELLSTAHQLVNSVNQKKQST